MDILVYQQMRIMNRVSQAMKDNLEKANIASVVISGFKELPENEAEQDDFEVIIFEDSDDIEKNCEEFKKIYAIKSIVSLHQVKDGEIIADARFPVSRLNVKIMVNETEFNI